ncbi:multidrug MFS transporter [Sulfolobus sp. A20]|uniref:3'-flap repair endonuclease Xpf n=1 Tax=Sulfolobaceae TaxID=118883 RepID=UPI000845C833|nr:MULTISPECIES: 3'-flap repair endonuclease Xpf [unclassified Sulfolobus]TRM74542.1 multidrug MFS transporter [Sulfolobus sp. E5]TRM74766.1 multidrug MFS transporter [Sulfolobus sp. A20-N-F8]TRM78969.1 multidrug MFS transporter [Sulfolobus sp. B5]TRM83112.1 multidrug MFS transporter [Sulfolobus sp. A20-N-F6]TRM85594.1 multidrug MFS transporter [Sulfolobus sp. F3]TRN02493.1 multidrug MFS transporter [Sulfolobus sp. F1]
MVIRIYVDDREKASGIPELLKELGLIVIFSQLEVADYVVADGVAIERKSVPDLINSIFDKRFFDQISRLSDSYRVPILILEGDINLIRKITDRWKAINNALISLTLDYDVKVIYSRDKRDTSEILKKLAEKFQLSSENYNRKINLHNKSKLNSVSDIQLYIVESLPSVGTILAERLLNRFGTIQNICNASISELEKALGSRKKAEEIYKILRTYYSQTNTDNKSEDKKKGSSLFDYL